MAQALAHGMAGIEWISAIHFVDPSEPAAATFQEICPRAVRHATVRELASVISFAGSILERAPEAIKSRSRWITDSHTGNP